MATYTLMTKTIVTMAEHHLMPKSIEFAGFTDPARYGYIYRMVHVVNDGLYIHFFEFDSYHGLEATPEWVSYMMRRFEGELFKFQNRLANLVYGA